MKARRIVSNNFFMLKFIWKYTPFQIIHMIGLGLFSGCIATFSTVVFVKELFDLMESGAEFKKALSLCLVYAIIITVNCIYDAWYTGFFHRKQFQILTERMQNDLFKKALSQDLDSYDNPDFYNDYIWSIREADLQATEFCYSFLRIFRNIVRLLTVLSILLKMDIAVSVIMLYAAIKIIAYEITRSKLDFTEDNKQNSNKRKCDYIGRVFYMADYAKELRLSQISDVMEREFDKSVADMISIHKKNRLKRFIISLAGSWQLLQIAVITLLIYKITKYGDMTIGEFTATIAAIGNVIWSLRNIGDCSGRLTKIGLYVDKLRKFLDKNPVIVSIKKPEKLDSDFSGLELKNVSFRYNSKSPYILKNVSLKINPGEKIALVGINGGGKTTLVKLLLRLYDVTEGSICYNGKDIRMYDIHEYRSHFGTVFQDFQLYAATLADNVLADVYTKEQETHVLQSLHQAGLDERLGTMKKGISTNLTKEFDKEGTNLSGGEGQKVAIARAFASKGNIYIMDEPSSALDPIAEYKLNNSILETSKYKTVIFISHRLSTTCDADKIYLLDNGHIAEEGSHTILLKLNGKYAAMFNLQAEKYRHTAS